MLFLGESLPLDRALSAARARADGAQILVLLESPEVSRLLQLAGGAVLVAATVGAAVPAEVSRRLASELDERGWDGDGELAALLRAEPLGPAPGQRTVSVRLEEVADLLQGDTELSYGSYSNCRSHRFSQGLRL